MQLQAGRSGTNLLLNTLATAVITLAGDPHVDRETVARLDHLAHERGSRRAGRRVRARRRTGPSAQKCGDARSKRFVHLLRADKVNVGIKSTGRHDLVFSSNDIGRRAHDHVRMHAVHHIGIASLADSRDQPILDTDVSLVDSAPVDDQRIRNDGVQTFGCGPLRGLAHALAKGLAAAERALISINRTVLFHPHPKVGQPQSDQVPGGGSKHPRISFAIHCERRDQRTVRGRRGFRNVSKTLDLQALQDLLGSTDINLARSNGVAALDNAIACNLDQRDRLGVTGFESYRSPRGDIEPVSVGPQTVKMKLRVGLDEVIVGSDLFAVKNLVARMCVERQRTNLDWAIALAHHLQSDALAAIVQSNPFVLHWQDSTWHLLREVVVRVRIWERIRRWNGEEAAVQRFL